MQKVYSVSVYAGLLNYWETNIQINFFLWSRYVLFWMSFLAVVLLLIQKQRNRLFHLSDDCIDKPKLIAAVVIKVIMLIQYILL